MNKNEKYDENDLDRIGSHWDYMYANADASIKKDWWDSGTIISHINKKICGEASPIYNAGQIKVCRSIFPNVPFKKGLSIGCGSAIHELGLVRDGLVSSFDLYELSKKRLHAAYENFKKHGLEDRVKFYHGDIFANVNTQKYDFIYWSGSLHHMYDTEQAIISTYNMLTEGGCFFVNDFVGMNRFQWTDVQMKYINDFRNSLPEDCFINYRLKVLSGRILSPPNIDDLIRMDPSEARDSEAIIPALKKHVNLKFFMPTGGVIYHIALAAILEQIPENSPILKLALKIDDKLTDEGLYNYAFALGMK